MNLYTLPLLSLFMLCASPAYAQDAVPDDEKPKAEKPAPTPETLAEVFRKVLNDPENLEINFSYANMAMQLGKYDAAITAYERMLMIAPDLDRVKLDMALAYARLGNFTQARELFDEVLSKNPPDNVKENVKKLIAQIDDAEKRHKFDGNIVTGINYDSNANASPGSNQVDLFGVNVQLTGTSLAREDQHFFTAGTVNHTYTTAHQQAHKLKTSATAYKTRQNNLGSLNLTVLSAKTAFTYNITKKNGGGRLTPTVGFDDINLGGFNYQENLYGQLGYEHPLSNKFALSGLYRYEKRLFYNNPGNTTLEGRTGRAREQRLAAKIFMTDRDLLDVGVRLRQEVTREVRHDNRQQELILSHTHIFDGGIFLNTTGTVKRTHYKGVDVLVNPNTVRRDHERSYTFTLGKQLTPNTTIAGAYQYKTVGSNIQNFAYENERTTVSLAYKF